ncbi:MAG: 50S ribosomal protein L35 [Patescibacteria group bacterium]
MKLKSHSGTKKRIKVTKNGKILYRKPCQQHLLINKSKRQKAMGGCGIAINASDVKQIKHLLPQSF